MRWMLLLIALAALLWAAWLERMERNSYSDYSEAQLTLLETELSRLPDDPARTAEQHFEQELLQHERQRRTHQRLALGGAAGAGGVGLLLLLTGALRGRRAARASLTDEDARLMSAMGNPQVLAQGARHKAAALLGVTPEAPPAVIEAALEAQLRERDLSRLDGLAPDLQRMMLEQREALVRARDLLLRKPEA